MHFLIEKIQIFYGIWSPKGAQRDPKIEDNSGTRPWTSPGEPNGAKMEPKWTQNGANMELKYTKMEPKWTQHGAKME